MVEAELAGRGSGIKEYVLGVEVFDRSPTFDPRTDSIVRVEAVKIRKRLQAYYRSEGTASLPGIGLGLAISHSLVGQMGGRLDVESEPGAGSTFTIRLRRSTGASD